MFYEVSVKTDQGDVDLGSCWVEADESAEAKVVAIDKLWDPSRASGGASPVATILQEWDAEFDYDAKTDIVISAADLLEAARKLKEREGELEIDDNAEISRGSDGGAYVQTWAWIDNHSALKAIAEKPQPPTSARRPKP